MTDDIAGLIDMARRGEDAVTHDGIAVGRVEPGGWSVGACEDDEVWVCADATDEDGNERYISRDHEMDYAAQEIWGCRTGSRLGTTG